LRWVPYFYANHNGSELDLYLPTRDIGFEIKLSQFLKPDMLPGEYAVAQVEGWILGVR
jgi:hypothetical protein